MVRLRPQTSNLNIVPLYLVVDHVVIIGDAKRCPLDRDVDGRLVHVPKVLLKRLEGRFQETPLKCVVGHDQARGPRVEDGLVTARS
jgi:hypothetical protein